MHLMNHVVIFLDESGAIVRWSDAARTMFRFLAEEIHGKHFSQLFNDEDGAARLPERLLLDANRHGPSSREVLLVRKDGSQFRASSVTVAMPDRDGCIYGYVSVIADLTSLHVALFGEAEPTDQTGMSPGRVAGAGIDAHDRKDLDLEHAKTRDELEQRITERTTQLEAAVVALQQEAARRRKLQAARKQLLRRMTALQEEERRRIARELHDSVGQFVTAINLGVKTIKEHLPSSGPARERADKLSSLTTELGQEVHRLALELRPRSLDDVSLQDALQQHLDAWSAHAKIAPEFHAQGMDGFVAPTDVASTVYRVVQEALVNVARHSEATRVSVVVERHANQLSVIVEDDGKGFDADRGGVKGGTKRLGLLGMRERASLVGGELDVESFPGGGTTVFLRIPLPEVTHG